MRRHGWWLFDIAEVVAICLGCAVVMGVAVRLILWAAGV